MRALIPVALLCLCFLGFLTTPTNSSADGPKVLEWGATWTEFADDFSDGQFFDGTDPMEPAHYSPCADCVETGGALILDTSEESFVVVSSFTLPGESTLRATFRLPELADSKTVAFGVRIEGADKIEFLLFNSLGTISVRFYLNSDTLAVVQIEPAAASAIELVLEARLNSDTNQIVPTAKYRLCQNSPCESEQTTPLESLGEFANAGIDAATSRNARLVAYGVFDLELAVEVEEWRVETSFVDDFEDAVFGSEVAYTLSLPLGNITQAEGRLSMEPDPALVLGLSPLTVANLPPGPTETSAVYEWLPPLNCLDSFGILQSTLDSSRDDKHDVLSLALFRTANLDDAEATSEALYVFLQSETEAEDNPIVMRSTVSTDPDNDPTLVGVKAIELRLRTVDGAPGQLLPEAEYRLCATEVCDGPFTPLVDHTAAEPGRRICRGIAASVFDPPVDGGELSGIDGLNTFLFAVLPEPTALLGQAVVLTAIWKLSRVGRRRRIGVARI